MAETLVPGASVAWWAFESGASGFGRLARSAVRHAVVIPPSSQDQRRVGSGTARHKARVSWQSPPSGIVERLFGEVRLSTFSAREDQLSLVARFWLERPTREDRFWRGSLYWADAVGDTFRLHEGGVAFASEEKFLRSVNAKLMEVGGKGLRPVRRG